MGPPSTVLEDQFNRMPPVRIGKLSVGPSTEGKWQVLTEQSDIAGVHRLKSAQVRTCSYALGCLCPMKLTFLMDTGYTHNLLSKAIFDRLSAEVKEHLEPWDTTTTLAYKSGLPVYGHISLSGCIRNSFFYGGLG